MLGAKSPVRSIFIKIYVCGQARPLTVVHKQYGKFSSQRVLH